MGRVEILSGRERRRFWPDEQKLAILEEVSASDTTVAEVARRYDLIPQQIYTWRRQFAKRAEAAVAQSAGFLPVAIVPDDFDQEATVNGRFEKRAPARSAKIEIRCKGGRILKVDAGLDASILEALIRTVEAV